MKNNDLILQKLSKSYHGQVVFSDLSLALSPGNAYCLMAPSGTGETTLFRILMGLETPDSGTIDGLKNLKISAVFQEDRLLEDYDVLTNLRFVCRQRLSDAELSAYAATLLPQNALSQPVCEFSGGMKRRLSLLRALLVPFDLLILDEPFNGLDSENRKKAAALVRNRAQDKILLFAAQRTLRFWVQKFSARSIPIVLCKSVVPKETKMTKISIIIPCIRNILSSR